jgi:hypothetical protein
MTKHYVNEAGTDLVLDCGVNVGTVAWQYIVYKKPSGVTGSWTASLHDTYSSLAGVSGTYLLKYTLTTTSLDEPGRWLFHAHVGAADGTWLGERVEYNVYDMYE